MKLKRPQFEKAHIGTMTIVCTFKYRLEVSLWDAFKMRLMGRLPAARILTHIFKTTKDAT